MFSLFVRAHKKVKPEKKKKFIQTWRELIIFHLDNEGFSWSTGKNLGNVFTWKLLDQLLPHFYVTSTPSTSVRGAASCVLTFQFQFKHLDKETKEMSIDKRIKGVATRRRRRRKAQEAKVGEKLEILTSNTQRYWIACAAAFSVCR